MKQPLGCENCEKEKRNNKVCVANNGVCKFIYIVELPKYNDVIKIFQ